MLRNQVDLKMAGTDGATKATLLSTPPEPIVTKAEPAKPQPVVQKKVVHDGSSATARAACVRRSDPGITRATEASEKRVAQHIDYYRHE